MERVVDVAQVLMTGRWERLFHMILKGDVYIDGLCGSTLGGSRDGE